MALTPAAFLTVSQLKQWHVPAIPDDQLDPVLERIINGVCGYVEARTGRVWQARSLSIVRSGDGRPQLLRLERPINSVTSLTIDDVAIAPASYWAHSDRGRLVLKTGVFAAGIGNVALTYNAGYTDVEQGAGQIFAAALDLAKAHLDELQNGTISLQSISIGPVNAFVRPGLHPRIEKYLDSLKDVRG